MQQFPITFVTLLVASAIINGMLFSVLILRKTENPLANRFLALLIFCLAFTQMTQLWVDYRVYDAYPFLHVLPMSLVYLIGPAFYFYIRAMTDPTFKFKDQHWWHFSWIILDYLHSIYHLIYGRGAPHPLLHNFTEVLVSYSIIIILAYGLQTGKFIKKYQEQLKEQVSATERLTLKWLQQLINILGVTLLVTIILTLVDYQVLINLNLEFYNGWGFQYRYIFNLLMAFTIYWLSIGGFKQGATLINPDLTTDAQLNEHRDFSKSAEKLLNLMQKEKMYLDPELTLKSLSLTSGLSEKEISLTINRHFEKNFYTFVNEFRVEEVKARFTDPGNAHFTILSLALDAGFNSKATFNRIFKSYTGQSPKAFREQAID